jgi:hypothetical protein
MVGGSPLPLEGHLPWGLLPALACLMEHINGCNVDHPVFCVLQVRVSVRERVQVSLVGAPLCASRRSLRLCFLSQKWPETKSRAASRTSRFIMEQVPVANSRDGAGDWRSGVSMGGAPGAHGWRVIGGAVVGVADRRNGIMMERRSANGGS